MKTAAFILMLTMGHQHESIGMSSKVACLRAMGEFSADVMVYDGDAHVAECLDTKTGSIYMRTWFGKVVEKN